MGLFDSLKAKMKEIIKSPREKARELYLSKSLQELSEIVGSGLKDNNEIRTVDEGFGLADAYLEKLMCSKVEEGGFGFHDAALAREIVSEGSHFAGSVYDFGTHERNSKAMGKYIQNYRLEFLKNYLLAGNTQKFHTEWFRVLFRSYHGYAELKEEGFSLEGINEYLEKDDLKNPECYIYDTWVYEGADIAFTTLKLKCAIYFIDFMTAREGGYFLHGDPQERSLHFEDVKEASCTSEKELSQFLADCRVVS